MLKKDVCGSEIADKPTLAKYLHLISYPNPQALCYHLVIVLQINGESQRYNYTFDLLSSVTSAVKQCLSRAVTNVKN